MKQQGNVLMLWIWDSIIDCNSKYYDQLLLAFNQINFDELKTMINEPQVINVDYNYQ